MSQGSENAPATAPPQTTEEMLTEGMGRRDFMTRVAALGLTATGLSVFLSACANIAEDGITATPGPPAFPTPTPFTERPGSSPTPTPEPTSTPQPTATPTPSPLPLLGTEVARVSHLLRRAGFGASPEELDRFVDMGLDATVDYLLDYESVDDSEMEALLAGQEFDLEERLAHLQRWWLLRMVHTKRPLQEKMTLFYHGILTSSFRKAGKGPATLDQNQLFRDNALGRYDDLLKAISRDPAMLIWLDSRSNRKAAPNENYARELMELFSLGIGHYTEEDVRESARAFTGWEIRRKQFFFNPNQHDNGVKVFLGTPGNLTGDDVVDIIEAQPAAAEYITRRLFEFFAYDDPEPAVVQRLVKVFRDNDTEIKPVVREILTSDEFYSPRAARAIIKSPIELVASTARALKLETAGMPFPGALDAMGQVPFEPPNVAGWPGGTTWINSSTLLQRVNFANLVATGRSPRLRFDPVKLAEAAGAQTDEEQVDFFARLLLGGEIAREDRKLLVDYMAFIHEAGLLAAGRRPTLDEKLRSVVYLVLASPEYQLA
ncbi:MAG: DUF1800 domain-containing protein [Dehalococcoidia bacterium]